MPLPPKQVKKASKKRGMRMRKPPVVKAYSPAPDVISVHIRAEPEHVAELLPHTNDPKTFIQKLLDWLNDK